VSLDTFDNLKVEILDWSHRDDIDLKLETFIEMAEVEMFSNPQAVLKIKGQETSDDTLTTTARVIPLPTDFQSMRSIRLVLNNNGSETQYRAPEQLIRVDTTGLPRFFTVIGNNIEFDRVPDFAYTIELRYFATPTPLSSTNATNTVLDNHPNIYLFGCLWAVFEFAVDEIQAQKYYSRFISAILGANKRDKEGRFGTAPAMRIESSTP